MGISPIENRNREPLPLDALGKRLCETFFYRWNVIVAENDADPQWQTQTKYPMRPRVLWREWNDASHLVGVRFDSQTYYALIDIDIESPYHPSQNPNFLATIRAALETIGIYRTVLIQSSHSKGLHLYIPLTESVPTFGLATSIYQCLAAQGLTIAPGHLEIFPNCKAFAKPGSFTEYHAHRLPLQPESASYLLDDDLNPISNELGHFFRSWDTAAAGQDLEELRSAIATARTNRKRKRGPTIVEDWIKDLRTEMQEGWTAHGQTNHLLKTIACYGVVFEGLKGDALAQYVQQTAINSEGYTRWCRHQHEIAMRAVVWARSAEGYYWRLGDAPKRSGAIYRDAENNIVSFNAVRSKDAQNRIRAAIATLEQAGQFPSTITARVRAIEAQGISSRTLYRHPEIWHPLHYQPAQTRSCKTIEPDRDTAIFDPDFEESSESPGSLNSNKFYTREKNMKGAIATLNFTVAFLTFSGDSKPFISNVDLENPND